MCETTINRNSGGYLAVRLMPRYCHRSTLNHPVRLFPFIALQSSSNDLNPNCLLLFVILPFIDFVCRAIDSATLFNPIFHTHLPLYTPVFTQQQLRPLQRFQKILVSCIKLDADFRSTARAWDTILKFTLLNDSGNHRSQAILWVVLEAQEVTTTENQPT